jgi:hypothetical protein
MLVASALPTAPAFRRKSACGLDPAPVAGATGALVTGVEVVVVLPLDPLEVGDGDDPAVLDVVDPGSAGEAGVPAVVVGAWPGVSGGLWAAFVPDPSRAPVPVLWPAAWVPVAVVVSPGTVPVAVVVVAGSVVAGSAPVAADRLSIVLVGSPGVVEVDDTASSSAPVAPVLTGWDDAPARWLGGVGAIVPPAVRATVVGSALAT